MQTQDILTICSPMEAAIELTPLINLVVTRIMMPLALEHNATRTGGYFTFWRIDPNTGIAVPVIGFPVGQVSTERFLLYIHHANDKPAYLSTHPMNISSYQSRDDSDPDVMKRHYGGAIRCSDGILFSFSGFSELQDEMVCVIAAERRELITAGDVDLIVQASDNKQLAAYRSRRTAGVVL